MAELPPEYLDSATPPDVIVTDRIRPFIEDPTLGEPLGAASPDAPPIPASPAHRLVTVDTRFFLADENGRRQGGLFGLDGVHPTTSGYGVITQATLDVLAGAGLATTPVDFAALRSNDTLNAQPPALVADMIQLAAFFLSRFVSQR